MVQIFSIPRGLGAQQKTSTSLKRAFYQSPKVTSQNIWEVYKETEFGVAVGGSSLLPGIILWWWSHNDKWILHPDSGLAGSSGLISLDIGIDYATLTEDYILVGYNGTIVRGSLSGVEAGEKVYAFSLDPEAGVITTKSLYGVTWMYKDSSYEAGANRAIVVGRDGTILKYDAAKWTLGVTWDVIASGITEHLRDVDWEWSAYGSLVGGYTLGVAVGADGGIYKTEDEGITWTLWRDVGVSLDKVYVYNADYYPAGDVDNRDVWICGNGGYITRFYHGEWIEYEKTTAWNLHAIAPFGENEVYCCGDGGTLLYFDGASWIPLTPPTRNSLQSISGLALDTMVISAAGGVMLNYFGDVLPIENMDRAGGAQPRPLCEEFYEAQVFDDEEIHDTNAHNSAIANMSKFKIVTIYVANTLDQIVSIQVKANRANSTIGATDVGVAFDVAATTGIEGRTLTPTGEGWLPYLFIEVTAAGVPTAGSLNSYILGRN